MATFYKIEAYNQGDRDSEDVLNSYELYTTFERACAALDVEIRSLVDTYNRHVTEYEEIVYTPPTLQTMKTEWRCIEYYELAFPDACYVFLVKKLTVVE